MNNKLYIFIFICILLQNACTKADKSKMEAANFVMNKIHATKGTCSFIEYTDTDKNSRKSIVLTFGGFQDIPPDFNLEKITSTASLLYIKQLDTLDYENYQEIQVILESDTGEFKKVYLINKLYQVESLFEVANKFITVSGNLDLDELKILIDTTSIADSTIREQAIFLSEIDSIYGSVSHIQYSGFHFDHITETNEPVMVGWITLTHEKEKTYMKFILSEAEKKILYIGINEFN